MMKTRLTEKIKIVSLLLVTVMLLSIFSCTDNSDDDPDRNYHVDPKAAIDVMAFNFTVRAKYSGVTEAYDENTNEITEYFSFEYIENLTGFIPTNNRLPLFNELREKEKGEIITLTHTYSADKKEFSYYYQQNKHGTVYEEGNEYVISFSSYSDWDYSIYIPLDNLSAITDYIKEDFQAYGIPIDCTADKFLGMYKERMYAYQTMLLLRDMTQPIDEMLEDQVVRVKFLGRETSYDETSEMYTEKFSFELIDVIYHSGTRPVEGMEIGKIITFTRNTIEDALYYETRMYSSYGKKYEVGKEYIISFDSPEYGWYWKLFIPLDDPGKMPAEIKNHFIENGIVSISDTDEFIEALETKLNELKQ